MTPIELTPDDFLPVAKADFQTPKALGVLNLAYGVGLYTVVIPAVVATAIDSRAKLVAKNAEANNKRVAELVEQEKKASDEEKPAIKKEREQLEEIAKSSASATPPVDFKKLAMPSLLGYLLAHLSSAVILDLMMIISGVGLLQVSKWGRWMASVTALLKVVRLLALAGVMTFVVAPAVTKTVLELERDSMKGEGKPTDAGPLIGQTLSGYSIGITSLGVIYPLVTIWLLSRASVREAFEEKARRPGAAT